MNNQNNLDKHHPIDISIDELVTRKDQLDIGYYILSNPSKILKRMNKTEREQYCMCLAESILNVMNEKEEKEIPKEYYHTLLDISRSGLNAYFSSMKDNSEPTSRFESHSINAYTYLFYYAAIGMEGCDRPFESIYYINESIKNTLFLIKIAEKLKPGCTVSWKNEIANMNYYRVYKNRICRSLFIYLDDDVKSDAAAMIQSYYQTAINELSKIGATQNLKQIEEELNQFKIELKKKDIRIRDQSYYDKTIDYSEPDDTIYEEWCWKNHLMLNLMNEYPWRMKQYVGDNLEWHPGGTNEIRFNDIISTYKHARWLLFHYSLQTNDKNGWEKPEMESVENFQDCYIRLYSIMDKLTKILNRLYPFKDNEQQKFYQLVGKFEHDTNCFLRGLYEINQDLSTDPRNTKKSKSLGTIDPFYKMNRVEGDPFFLRDMMAHAAVNIVDHEIDEKLDQKYRKNNIITMGPYDLKIESLRLMGLIREIILHFYLAVK